MKPKNTNKIKYKKALMATLGLFVGFLVNISGALALEMNDENAIQLVNSARKSAGLSTLIESNVLSEVAEDKLQNMIENNYFSHTSPSGVTPWYWFEESHYDYKYAGENLAINFSDAVDQHNAWMKSPAHKQNILNSDYKEIGMAVKKGTIGGKNTFITVQILGTENENSVKNVFAPAKESVNLKSTEVKKQDENEDTVLAVAKDYNSFKKLPIVQATVSGFRNIDRRMRVEVLAAWYSFIIAIVFTDHLVKQQIAYNRIVEESTI